MIFPLKMNTRGQKVDTKTTDGRRSYMDKSIKAGLNI